MIFSRAPRWLSARPVAHRGLHDRARGIVENTFSSVSAAIAHNFAVEVDLQRTSDNEAMVHHDDDLGRLTEGSGALRDITSAQLKAVAFKDTADKMMTLGDLLTLTDGRVPLVLEVKSRFDGDRILVTRIAELLARYQGPVAVMSFDPDQVMAIKMLMPNVTRGVVAERAYNEDEWRALPQDKVDGMRHLRHAFRTQPHFIAYWVNELPAPAPWIARTIFGCTLLTWTVRTQEQRQRASRYADQMIFEGFIPPP